MLLGYFKRNRTGTLLLVPLVTTCLWVFPFLNPQPVTAKHLMPFYELLINITGNNPYIFSFLALLLVIGEAFLLNHIVVKQEILNTATYMPAIIYCIFMSCSAQMTDLHPVLCANLFILLAINRLFGTHRKESAFSEVFDAGFYVSIATLFYVPSFIFLPLIWVSLILIRPFVWREWMISFIGFVVPYLFVAMYFFWVNKFDYLWYDKMFYPISIKKLDLDWPTPDYVLFGLMLLITLVSLTRVFRGVAINTVRARNNILVLFWLCGLSLLSVVIAPQFSIEYFSFLAIPCAVFCSNYFLSIKRIWFAELLFSMLLLVILLDQLVNINLFTL